MATIAEFEEIRRESQLRLVKALQAQNEAAKKRNKEFLEEVLVDKDNCKPQATLHCKLHKSNSIYVNLIFIFIVFE